MKQIIIRMKQSDCLKMMNTKNPFEVLNLNIIKSGY